MLKSNLKNLPKSVSEMSKGEIEEALKKKKECNAKALEIVEKMLENPINEEWFIDHLKYIRQTHFEDIIEERSITRNCGYPMCTANLKKVAPHQYHISTKLNKVYDTTERKKFCSDQCYRAGKYLKDQLLTSPLWFGNYENIPKFRLLPINNIVGIMGEEIDLGHVVPVKPTELSKDTITFTSVNEFASDSVQEMYREPEDNSCMQPSKDMENVDTHEEFAQVDISSSTLYTASSLIHEDSQTSNQMRSMSVKNLENECTIQTEINIRLPSISNQTQSIVSETSTKDLLQDDKTINSCSPYSQPTSSAVNKRMTAVNKHKTKNISKPDKTNIPGPISLVLHIETCLREWFNLETMIFLFGEKKVKEMIVDKGKSIREYYKVVSNASWDPKLQERYKSICRRLNLMELEDSQYDRKATKELRELKPLPDYKVIQEEGRKLEMKMNAFYQGKVTYVEDLSSTDNVTEGDELSPEPMLPLVDSHAQKCYRRRIVQDRLSKVLPDLLRTFGFESCDIYDECRALVKTFSLEAHNIFFKPPEWNLLGLIIINMLALKDALLRGMLNTEQSKKYRTMMLISYQQDSEYINTLLNWLTNIDNLVET